MTKKEEYAKISREIETALSSLAEQNLHLSRDVNEATQMMSKFEKKTGPVTAHEIQVLSMYVNQALMGQKTTMHLAEVILRL